jgi:2-octaprenyl-6-methoxyphenol hydroxylase
MDFEVIIVGGGIAGIITAIALSNEGVKLALIELKSSDILTSLQSDGRAFAISQGSWEIFGAFGLQHIFEDNAGLIKNIRVCDQDSPLHLDFSDELVDDLPLGYMIEHNILVRELYKEALKRDNITLFSGNPYSEVEFLDQEARIEVGGKKLTAQLIIAADGKNSSLRSLAGIEVNTWDYDQIAMVCNVSHQKNHCDTAIEKFLSRGPFAILPLAGGFSSSIVWVEHKDIAPIYLAMEKNEFLDHLKERFTDYLGELEFVNDIYSYPLSCKYAKKFYSKRMALVADAAHAIHPIAGQGINVGISDIEAIVNLIKEYRSLGLGIGSKSLLDKYHRLRFNDVMMMVAATDGVNRLFSNNIGLLKKARTMGLAALNKIDVVKKYITKYAMGV